jgi:hypothetical protein
MAGGAELDALTDELDRSLPDSEADNDKETPAEVQER